MTSPYTHALVIGKFYPPHQGHHLLVETAAAVCGQVSVVVMASIRESIALPRRVAWMTQAHSERTNVRVIGIMDDVPIDYADPQIWSQHVDLMRQALRSIDAPPVTHVFTSEAYGEEMGRRFGARSVCLDQSRALVPVSATRVRRDIPGNWHYLSSAVRSGLAARIVVVGAESTGTTTLSWDLAQRWRRLDGAHADTKWVAEFGRDYTVTKLARETASAQMHGVRPPTMSDLRWESDEFDLIARRQQRNEDEAAAIGGPVLFCDTDAVATAVWHQRYTGAWRDDIADLRRDCPATVYLVTHHEGVPFEQDGFRDGEHCRAWMTGRFLEVLQERRLPYLVLTGSRQERTDRAIEYVERALLSHWRFNPPLGEMEGGA